jgi:NAD(P)H dehydrogenase (quinone)
MRVYVVFAHPARDSFTGEVLDSFLAGLEAAGHEYEVGDLYRMGFPSDMDLGQYRRETGGDPCAPVPRDVLREQEKIARADALVFIYPLWWSDCPAKLKGWFDRVWTYGYAYTYEDGEHRSSRIAVKQALVICPAGHPVEHLEETGIAAAMRTIMLQDRLLGVGVLEARMVILGGMVPGGGAVRERNLDAAYKLGRELESPV